MSEDVNIFEEAVRKKLRWNFLGQINVEDLWDLGLEDLNSIYQRLKIKLKEQETDSLLEESKENTTLELKIKIIEYIFNTKQKEHEARMKELENKQQKQRILEIIKRKKDEKLEALDIEELEKMLE